VNKCLCIAPRAPDVMVTTLNNPIIMGHTNFLFGVELPWVQDLGSSPKSSRRLPANTLCEIK
jgi:hypothetical protein